VVVAAQKILEEEAYDLRAICEMKVRDWKEVNILSGHSLQLARFVQHEMSGRMDPDM